LYGPTTQWQDYFAPKDLQKAAQKIMSGALGTPDEALTAWLATAQNHAEKVEGTTAWMDREQQIQSNNAFKNQPENKYEELRQDALAWLGPSGKGGPLIDDQTLHDWPDQLTS